MLEKNKSTYLFFVLVLFNTIVTFTRYEKDIFN